MGPERGVDGVGLGFDLGLDEEAIGGVDLIGALVGIGGFERGNLPVFCCFSAASLYGDRKK